MADDHHRRAVLPHSVLNSLDFGARTRTRFARPRTSHHYTHNTHRGNPGPINDFKINVFTAIMAIINYTLRTKYITISVRSLSEIRLRCFSIDSSNTGAISSQTMGLTCAEARVLQMTHNPTLSPGSTVNRINSLIIRLTEQLLNQPASSTRYSPSK